MLDLGVYNKSNMNNLANIFEKIDAVKMEDKKYQSWKRFHENKNGSLRW